jgi:hypothetical protein
MNQSLLYDAHVGSLIGAEVDPFEEKKLVKRSKPPMALHYETVFWVVFAMVTMWTILDRFFINLFPMTINFAPLTESLAPVGITTIPFSVLFFDGFGRASGRLFVTALNGLFWTQCKTTENFLMEHQPEWIHYGDLRTTHNRTHYILGVFFMALPMLIHIFCAFLPAMTGVPLSAGEIRSATRVTPFIFSNNGKVEMFLSHDDLFRAGLMIVLFAFLMPFSISNFARNKWFSPTQWLHMFGAALFTIDMIRRSPHSQVFNTPVIAFYLIDRLVGLVWYRTGNASIIHKEQLDAEYMVVFLYIPKQKRQRAVGSTYYITLAGLEGMFEVAHPFVAFQNHSGQPLLAEWRNRDATSTTHKFYVDRSAGERKAFNRRDSLRLNEEQVAAQLAEQERAAEGIAQETDSSVFFSNWNTALVVQVHEWNRGRAAFTSILSRKELSSRIRFWGPYTSEYGQLTPNGKHEIPPTVLIGTGAGCSPILDFYTHFTTNEFVLPNPVTMYFSTNSIGLFQFVTDLTCAKAIHNWSVNAHLTQSEDFEKDFEMDERGEEARPSSTRDMKFGRLSFLEVLKDAPRDSKVFFCGAPALQWKVQVAAATYGLQYFPGHRFSGNGGISCHRIGAAKFVCRCTKFPLCLNY